MLVSFHENHENPSISGAISSQGFQLQLDSSPHVQYPVDTSLVRVALLQGSFYSFQINLAFLESLTTLKLRSDHKKRNANFQVLTRPNKSTQGSPRAQPRNWNAGPLNTTPGPQVLQQRLQLLLKTSNGRSLKCCGFTQP